MSNSGSTNFPPGSNISKGQNHAEGKGRNPARLVKVPGELRDVKKTVRVKADVIQVNKDRTVRLRTPYGAVDIRLPDSARLPIRGEEIILEIPPGQPPTKAQILSPPAPNVPISSPPQDGATIDTRSLQTPIDVLLRQGDLGIPAKAVDAATAYLSEAPVSESLAPIVRLEQIPPAAVQELLNEAFQIVNSSPDILERFQNPALQLLPPQTINPAALTTLPALLPDIPSATLFQSAPNFALSNSFTAGGALQTAPILQTVIAGRAAPPILQNIAFQSSATVLAGENLAPASSSQITAPLQEILQTPLRSTETAVQQPIYTKVISDTTRALSSTNPAQALYTPLRSSETIPIFLRPPSLQNESLFEKASLITRNQKATEVPATLIGRTLKNLPIAQVTPPGAKAPQFFILHSPRIEGFSGAQIFFSPLPQNILQDLQSGGGPAQQSAMSALAPPGAAATTPIPFTYFLTPEIWPSLNEAFQTLQQAAPITAQAFSNVTPSPTNPAQLSPALLLFVAAIRGGDMQSWLGERAIDTLRRAGKGDLLNRLGQEFRNLTRLSAEPVSQDWRAFPIPMLHDGQVDKIALYYRHDYEDGDGAEKSKYRQMRFVFDLNLDQMGMVQLDGLFRKKRLDLIVRTETQFSQAMQMSMRRAYSGAMAKTEVEGELSFQNAPESWVKITPSHKGEGVSI